MTQTRADEIKAEIHKTKDATTRALNRLTRTSEPSSRDALELYIDRKTARLWQLQDMLRREEAPLVRPEGKCVTLESNGILWKV